jgi:N6-L-threonylcarbamoyladenine synthase
MNSKLILGIETSCDESALALIQASGGIRAPKFKILKEGVASQIDIHKEFGGVVPNLAKREHLKNLPLLYKKLFGDEKNEAKLWKKIDFIAVTAGPGLEPALWTGIEFAKELSKKYKKPLLGANHLEGHLYSFLLPKTKKQRGKNPAKIFPAVALIVSGGHTILLHLKDLKSWKKLGETVDDAVGEAYDKVARLLSLPYPGGPQITRLALEGNPEAIAFPRPMLSHKNYQFSYSGLKTSVLYYLRDNADANKADVAASFAAAATDVLVKKTMRAVAEFKVDSVLLSGGVAADRILRTKLQEGAKKAGVNFLVPEFKWNTDNAVMIAAASYINFLRGKKFPPNGRAGSLKAKGDLGI